MDAKLLQRRLGLTDSSINQECSNIMSLFSFTTDEFCDQWEAYAMMKDTENEEEQLTKLSLEILKSFQSYLQKKLEQDNKRKNTLSDSNGVSSSVKRKKLLTGRENMSPSTIANLMATPVRTKRVDIDISTRSLNSVTPGSASSPLRPMIRSNGHTPSRRLDTPASSSPGTYRSELGSIVETLNPQISAGASSEFAAPIKLSMHVSLKQFQYRSMYQKLSESAEVLDQQIERMIQVVRDHYKFGDDQIGNPAAVNQNEIVAVGRITSEDPTEERLSSGSIMLETSRKIGSGARVKMNVKNLSDYAFFNGQIVVLKGINASGEFFSVTEVLKIPSLPSAAFPEESKPVQVSNRRIITASGPFTLNNNLDFEPLNNLIGHINNERPDAVILLGPFLDSTHPLIQQGDFELPGESDATLDDFFRAKISVALRTIAESITTIIIPNIRDTASNHAAFPQPALDKISLGLPKHIKCLPNPSVFSLDDVVISTASVDVVKDVVGCLLVKGEQSTDKTRVAFQQILSQRKIYPVFPASIPPTDSGITVRSGHSLDVPYWPLAEFHQTVPDILIIPSLTKPTALVANNVIGLNPGLLTKGNAAGTFAIINVAPPKVTGNADQPHEVWSRTRVDIQKI